MADPRIAAFGKVKHAQLNAQLEQAQFVNTIKAERAKVRQKARDEAESRALTVKQRQQEAAQANADAEAQARESVEATMPVPEVVRTDPKGIENSLATGAAGSIGGLAGINGGGALQRMKQLEGGAWSGGPPMTQGSSNPMDPLGLNRTNPISGGRLGEDVSVTKSGNYIRTQRAPLDTGIRGVDAVNAIIGAIRGGKPPLTTSYRSEDVDRMQQMRAYAAAQQEATIDSESKAIGASLYDISKGKAETKPADMLKGLSDQFGPAVGGEIFRRGINEAKILDFNIRKAEMLKRMEGEASKDRAVDVAREKEAMRAGRPETQVKSREAKILLELANTGKIARTEDRAFLDERQKLSLEDKILRSVTEGIGQGASSPAPAERKPITPDDYNKAQVEFGASLGRSPTRDDTPAFQKFLRDKGF